MITFDPIRHDMTILYSAMQLLGACKNVNHRLVAIFNVGECVVTRRGEKCVLDGNVVARMVCGHQTYKTDLSKRCIEVLAGGL